MKFAIGSDHGGLNLKQVLSDALRERGHDVVDFGTSNDASVDYPDFGAKVAKAVSGGEADKGVLVCGTGIGMSIIANKFPGIRAALVTDSFMARMAAEHNDANILVLGGRISEPAAAKEMLAAWLDAKFEGGRHANRLAKIAEYEKTR
jgi:ribose 5-phosphate isomerase B